MTQWVKFLWLSLTSLSSNPGTYRMDGENKFLEVVFSPLHTG